MTPQELAAILEETRRPMVPLDESAWRYLRAAVAALRSYQHGNGSPELAAEVADEIERFLKVAERDHRESDQNDRQRAAS